MSVLETTDFSTDNNRPNQGSIEVLLLQQCITFAAEKQSIT